MKKILSLFIFLMITLIPFNVNAKSRDIIISFFANGGTVSSGNVEVISDSIFIKDETVADVTYKYTDTINYLNSLDKKTQFTLKKGSTNQTKNYEWYSVSWKDYKNVYFSNSTKYKVSDIIKKLDIPESSLNNSEVPLEIFMHANYSSVNTKHVVSIIYKTNTGSLNNPHGTGIKEKSGTIYKEEETKIQKVKYGEATSDAGLVNYNNDTYVNIKKPGYSAASGKEWNTKPDGTGKSYSQSKVYKAKDLCDASKSDCTVTLYVNWKKTKSKKITVSESNITVSAGSSKTINANTDNNTGVTWSVDNSNIASVSNGTIKGLNKGTTKVTIRAKDNDNIAKKITVKVTKPSKAVAKSDNYVDNSNKSLKSLGTIDLSSYKSNCVHVPSDGKNSSAQGFTVANNYYVAAKRNQDDTSGSIIVMSVNASKKYNDKTKVINTIKKNNYFGHANGMTYNSKTKKLYITKTTNGKYKTFNYSELKDNNVKMSEGIMYRYTVEDGVISINPGALAYDSSNNKMYVASGWHIYVYDSTITNSELHIKKVRRDTGQDIEGYKGKILVIRYNADGKSGGSDLKTTRNAIDIYNATNGNYEGSYIIKTKGEIESLSYNQNSSRFAFYVQNVTGNSDYDCIQEASMKIN